MILSSKFYESNSILKQLGIIIKDQTNNFLKLLYPEEKKHNNLEAELISHMEIFNHSALLSVSDLKGKIIYANENFCKISGYRLDELLGQPHSIVRHPDTPAAVFKDMWTKIGSGSIWQGELKNKSRNGTDYWVIATIAPVMGTNGKPVKYISVRYDITSQKKAEEELREAKKKIDNELFENIAYAKHIHSSFLSNDEGNELSSDSFLIYRPQKMISGDFYKIERKGDKLMLVIGDSTGHGISASYISVLALNILSRIMKFNFEDPGKILKMINHELNRITHYNKEKQLIESADMIICCIDKNLMKLTYASAKMRAFIIRGNEVIILEKDKITIGAEKSSHIKITDRKIDIEKGDLLYIASDGAFDQIGGPKDKCMGFNHFISIIKRLRDKPMHEQNIEIHDALDKWKGENEQTDDITLFGIRI
jgi:PAS domain S-box-containing protein